MPVSLWLQVSFGFRGRRRPRGAGGFAARLSHAAIAPLTMASIVAREAPSRAWTNRPLRTVE